MLNGIRVVEIEGLGPGPFAAMMLCDLGAEVIVVHRPEPVTAISGETNLLDRGKKSIVLDLKDSADLATAIALISTADALIEGFRPGVMERLGLGPDECLAANPKLVYGRMTGWGQQGPRASQAGHDLNYLATSGALWYASEPGQPPFPPPTMLGDVGGGALYLVAGVLAGLLNAAKTGKGTVVDAAIVDGSAHLMALLMSLAPAQNLKTQRGESLLDGPHWSRCYTCADGRHISVQCLEPKFYAIFLNRLGLTDDPRFKDQYEAAKWPEQSRQLAEIFALRPVDHWVAVFEGADACVAAVLSPNEAARDSHIADREIWHDHLDGLQPAPAPRFDGKSRPIRPPAIRRGHGAVILDELKARGLI